MTFAVFYEGLRTDFLLEVKFYCSLFFVPEFCFFVPSFAPRSLLETVIVHCLPILLYVVAGSLDIFCFYSLPFVLGNIGSCAKTRDVFFPNL